MGKYLNLERRFALLKDYTPEEIFSSDVAGKRLAWSDVLEGRFSVIVGRANFGKTMELTAQAKALRAAGKHAVFVSLHKLLAEDDLGDALHREDFDAFEKWRTDTQAPLTVFVDSLDEASLAREDGLRIGLRRVSKAINWPDSDVSWVLSSRPAVLTSSVLDVLQAELRTTLHLGHEDDEEEVSGIFDDDDEGDAPSEPENDGHSPAYDAPRDVEAASAGSKVEVKPLRHEQLKVYRLLPLDKRAASHYLAQHCGVADPAATLDVAARFGLGRLREGPGGLDILAYVDPTNSPPHDLTAAFDKMVEAVQQQQRTDPRERHIGSPTPERLDEAIEKLASASCVCQLLNIELSPDAPRIRDGVLSARPLIGPLLSEQAMNYLLGSRLFIDSGQHQVKLYPDELLPFLAARRLAGRVRSPEDATRLLSNFTWSATTGECGVYRVFLPLAGWLATLNPHCRDELLRIDPQAVAFFGDLRNPHISLSDAVRAIEGALERLVASGDTLGRTYYMLTAENYWQAGKEGIEPTLQVLFEKHGNDWYARDALLDIASHAKLEILREAVLASHGRDYFKLAVEAMDLHYILMLGRQDDFDALAGVLATNPRMPESQAVHLLEALAWNHLDARDIAYVASEQFGAGHGGHSLDWTLTRDVADRASLDQLYALTRSLLLRLVRREVPKGRGPDRYRADQKFVELVADLLALVIRRGAAEATRAAKLCLVLNRFARKHHHGASDTRNLRSALEANKPVRLEFLRGLVRPTDKSADGIYRAVFLYDQLCPVIDGDEVALEVPGFTQLLQERRRRAAAPPPAAPSRPKRGFEIDKQSKAKLQSMVDGLRTASKEGALAWVAGWLVRTIHQSRYGECNFSLFEQEAGDELASAVRAGLSVLWRSKEPTSNEDEPNSKYNITIAGLQGLHLDLGDGSALPPLTELEVRRALRYAHLEINGYPKWFWPLVRSRERIAFEEFEATLGQADLGRVSLDKAETLVRHLAEAPQVVQQRIAQAAWHFIFSHPQLTEHTTEAALKVAAADTDLIDQATFEAETWRRMSSAYEEELPVLGEPLVIADEETVSARRAQEARLEELRRGRANAVVWGGFWLWRFPGGFAAAWERWHAGNRRAAEDFVFELAAYLGEDSNARLKHVADSGSDGLKALKMLYEWVRSVVREEDDIKHEEGRAFPVGKRDRAKRLREALVPAIAHTKSEEAYVVLDELRLKAGGARAKYIRYEQFMMREAQTAKKPMPQTEYPAFETNFAPKLSGYVDFAMAVHADLLSVKRQIETGEFSLRRFFNALNFQRIKTDNDGLALEEDFQSLLGSELNHAAGRRYSVTLETILPERTRRDVLCQTGSLRATIELKMSVRWTFANYLEALKMQLRGQYMMAPNSKIGFFVVVLQKPRTWRTPDGRSIRFAELLEILATKAREFEAADSSVYLRVIGIDATPKEDFRARAAQRGIVRTGP